MGCFVAVAGEERTCSYVVWSGEGLTAALRVLVVIAPAILCIQYMLAGLAGL